MDIQSPQILEERFQGERDQNHANRDKDSGEKYIMLGNRKKNFTKTQKTFNILREIRGNAAPINQNQDALMQKWSKKREKSFWKVNIKEVKKSIWQVKCEHLSEDEQKDRDCQSGGNDKKIQGLSQEGLCVHTRDSRMRGWRKWRGKTWQRNNTRKFSYELERSHNTLKFQKL